MGLSQNEIDKLMTETPDSAAAQGKKSLLEGLAVLYSRAVENILPVITSTDSVEAKVEPTTQGRLGGLVQPLVEGNVFLAFRLPALAQTPVAGVIGTPLALEISQRMMGQEGAAELNDALLSALGEAFNNVLGAFDSALKDEFGIEVEHTDMKFLEGAPLDALQSDAGMGPDVAAWTVRLDTTIDRTSGPIGLILTDACVTEILRKHPSFRQKIAAAQPAARANAAGPSAEKPATVETPISRAETPVARFEELEPRATSGESKGIDLILDVPLSIAVELGRKKLSVKEILGLVPGSLVELDKLAGEPVDLLVNGKLFAKGEVVVIDENFGVRVSSIVTPKERIERLGR